MTHLEETQRYEDESETGEASSEEEVQTETEALSSEETQEESSLEETEAETEEGMSENTADEDGQEQCIVSGTMYDMGYEFDDPPKTLNMKLKVKAVSTDGESIVEESFTGESYSTRLVRGKTYDITFSGYIAGRVANMNYTITGYTCMRSEDTINLLIRTKTVAGFFPHGSPSKYPHGYIVRDLRDIVQAFNKVYQVSLVPDKDILEVGETTQLHFVPESEAPVAADCTYASNDEEVATVDENGLVTAVSDGKAVISCTIVINYFIQNITCDVTIRHAVTLTGNIYSMGYEFDKEPEVFPISLEVKAVCEDGTEDVKLSTNLETSYSMNIYTGKEYELTFSGLINRQKMEFTVGGFKAQKDSEQLNLIIRTSTTENGDKNKYQHDFEKIDGRSLVVRNLDRAILLGEEIKLDPSELKLAITETAGDKNDDENKNNAGQLKIETTSGLIYTKGFEYAVPKVEEGEEIVTVDQNGMVTPARVGKTTVTCTFLDDETVSAECAVQVVNSVNGLTDTDGDGLPDIWETQGVDTDGDGVIDLHIEKMGADPNVPDIFVEVDWMVENFQYKVSWKPTPRAMQIVMEHFYNHGINIHIDVGADSVMIYDPDKDYDKMEKWGNLSKGNSIKYEKLFEVGDYPKRAQWYAKIKENFDKGRSMVFRHCFFVNRFHDNEDNRWTSGVSSGIPHQYFIVANSQWIGDEIDIDEGDHGFRTKRSKWTDEQVASTFMHELGHTLGLKHGGTDEINYKPNYISLMNYLFQLHGFQYIKDDGSVDIGKGIEFANYSEYQLDTLDESDLNEFDGIDKEGKTAGTNLATLYRPRDMDKMHPIPLTNKEQKPVPVARNSIDFNQNLEYEESIAYNLNGTDDRTEEGTVPLEKLTSSKDWGTFRYNGGTIGMSIADVEKAWQESEMSVNTGDTIGIAVDYALTHGLMGNEGDCSVSAIYPSNIYKEFAQQNINVIVDNLYPSTAKATLIIESKLLEGKFEKELTLEAVSETTGRETVEVPIADGLECGEYEVKSTLILENGTQVDDTWSVFVQEAEAEAQTVEVNVHETKQVFGEDSDEAALNWECKDETIAKLESGYITGISEGETYICGYMPDDQTLMYSIKIVVNKSTLEKLTVPESNLPTDSKIAKGEKIELTSREGASIYYTTDGTEPTEKSALYAEPIVIQADTTIKAVAIKEGFEKSDIAVFQYTVSEDNTPEIDYGEIDPDDVPQDGKIPEGLWIAGINAAGYTYTGDAIIPEIRVYDYKTRLEEKTDYKISFKNNTNAGNATITVSGAGNYSGKETADFTILPADIGGDDVFAGDFYVKIKTGAQKPVPELYYKGNKLKNKKDFTIEDYENKSGVYSQTGSSTVKVKGVGNYTGERSIKLTAVEKPVKVAPISLAKANVQGFQKTVTYTGKAITQNCTLTLTTADGERTLREGPDYTVQYTNNKRAGTATVVFYGKNGYTGKLKKTYKIQAYDILENADSKIQYDDKFTYSYAKGGSRPIPKITYDGKQLRVGSDFTVSYKNNKAVTASNSASVVVKGKGNFKGTIQISYRITPQELSKMTLLAADRVYQEKPGIYKIMPTLVDIDGKKLNAGKDFDKDSIVYTYAQNVVLDNGTSKKAGEAVDSADIIPADTGIRIVIRAGTSGNYTGTFEGVYYIRKVDIKSAKVKIPAQIYTGKEIVPEQSDISVEIKNTPLTADDYEIIGCMNNVKKGKASIIIRGKGNYGGTKTVNFTIKSKGFIWWKKENG